MNAVCNSALEQIGTGVGAALTAVDCASTQMTAAAFGSLFAPGGALELALTILLTLYVAFFGVSLMLGRSNLSLRALVPRMVTIGVILAFATSWIAFRSVVWNLFVATPDYLATLLTRSDGSATLAFAGKLDVVFQAVQQASAGQENFDAFSPPGLMWLGAILLLLGTVGILVTARIALALLVALGPIFVVLALFGGTRGLFAGWLKGLVMLALTPLFAVLGGSLMLELAVPIIASLMEFPGQVNPQAAMAFFLLGAVHVALMVMAIKVAATMVAGWQVFGLTAVEPQRGGAYVPQSVGAAAARVALPRQPGQAASGARRVDVASAAAAGGADTGGRLRETRAVGNAGAGGGPVHSGSAASRTRGIGNRFRPVRTSALMRKPENAR